MPYILDQHAQAREASGTGGATSSLFVTEFCALERLGDKEDRLVSVHLDSRLAAVERCTNVRAAAQVCGEMRLSLCRLPTPCSGLAQE